MATQKLGTTLFLFAHQDDEFGVFWEISRLIDNGKRVAVAYLTSGDLAGRPSAARDEESTAVLGKLGVKEQDIFFLGRDAGIPDGQLSRHLDLVFQAVLNLADEIGELNRIYFLAWEGGHQDHDAVHLLGAALGARLGVLDRCFQFPLYTGAGCSSIFFRLFSPLPENGPVILSRIPWLNRFRFISYCFCYPSQKKTWIGLFPFFVLHYFFQGTQIFQPVSTARLKHAPHRGRVLYERRGFYRYEEFFNDASRFLNRYLNIDIPRNE